MTAVIVEDEIPAGIRLERLLIQYEFQVLVVLNSVKKATVWLKENKHPDIIFMDIKLRDGNCFEIDKTNSTLFKINNKSWNSFVNNKKYYEAISETFDSYLDVKTKDISRVCYESYDPDLFINENSKVWALKKEYTEVAQKTNYPRHFQITDTSKKVDVIIKWFNKKSRFMRDFLFHISKCCTSIKL